MKSFISVAKVLYNRTNPFTDAEKQFTEVGKLKL